MGGSSSHQCEGYSHVFKLETKREVSIMRRDSLNAAVCAGILLCAAGFLLSSLRLLEGPMPITTFRSVSGEQLASVFDGLPARPDYDLKLIQERSRRDMPPRSCGARADLNTWSNVTRLLGFATVSADQACIATPCSSYRYVPGEQPCIGNCQDDPYAYAVSDPVNGLMHTGFRQTGEEGCAWDPGVTPVGHCPCIVETCDNGCVECNPNYVMGRAVACAATGKRCEPAGPGGCCESYTCQDGNAQCKYPQDCPNDGPYQLNCDPNEGCCKPIDCQYGSEACSPEFHCDYNNKCARSNCSSTPYCHNIDQCSALGTTCNIETGCCWPPPSPILIDLDGNGFALTSAQTGVMYDIGATGHTIKISWTAAGSDDAWLALDRNANGRIDNGAELFGNVTPQPDKPGEKNGFKALAVYDKRAEGGNDDGWIDSKDAIFPKLLLWRDTNHNGVSEPEELFTLSQLGVSAISVDYKESKWTDLYGNQFRYRSKVIRGQSGGGAEKWAYDVFLMVEGAS